MSNGLSADAEIRTQLDRVPIKAGKICGSVFSMAALAVVLVRSLIHEIGAIQTMQMGIIAMAVFFAIGYMLGRIGHQLVHEASPVDGPPSEEPAPLEEDEAAEAEEEDGEVAEGADADASDVVTEAQ